VGALVCDCYGFVVDCTGSGLHAEDAPLLLAALKKSNQSNAVFSVRGNRVIVKEFHANPINKHIPGAESPYLLAAALQ
jgi:hypothetical protein